MQAEQDYLVQRAGRVELSRTTRVRLTTQREERLRLWDLASLEELQPLFVKFWQLFLQLQTPPNSTSAPLQTLGTAFYQQSLGLIHKALGSSQGSSVLPTAEASYTRFCYDFSLALTRRFPQSSLEE